MLLKFVDLALYFSCGLLIVLFVCVCVLFTVRLGFGVLLFGFAPW